MANPLLNPAENVAPRWVYQAILVEMTDKTLYGLRATQRHKEIRGIFDGRVKPPPGCTAACSGFERNLTKYPTKFKWYIKCKFTLSSHSLHKQYRSIPYVPFVDI